MDKETEQVVRAHIKQLHEFFERNPEAAAKFAIEGACACMGPAPECRCARRARLIREFVEGS